MGWETLAFVGLNAVKGEVAISNANKAAKATIQEGNIALANKSKDISRQAGALTNSFLSSGLTLDGTPRNSIDSIYDTGVDDLNQLSTNYNNKAKSQISAGRTAALEDLASGFGEAAFSGGGSSITDAFGSQGGLSRLADTGSYNFVGPLESGTPTSFNAGFPIDVNSVFNMTRNVPNGTAGGAL